MSSSLHTHSAYSLLDGFSMPEENIKRASGLGLKALAITEHGEVTSWPYYSELQDKYQDVKLLYGIEAYECSDREVKDPDNKYWHLILIARNELGRQAINRLSTLGHLHGFYSKPRISLSDIAKENTDNLIVTSACLASHLSREKDYEKCIALVNEYKAVCKHFYLEIQAHDNATQAEYNQKIMRLSKDTNTKVVVTNDVHAATKEDLKYQDVFVRIANDRETAAEIYDGCYFMSDSEIHTVLDKQIGADAVERCLRNTDEVADLCEAVTMPWHEPELPKIQIPPQYASSAAYLRDLVKQGFARRGCDKFDAEKQRIYKQRVKEELEVIEKKDFCDYFLILVDYISWCRKNGIIVGPGRGSACGSLVCYLIGITELDSIKYDLDFGRFLTIERKDLPDVDVDVSDRAPVVEYLTNKYGEDRVVQVMNIVFTTPVTSIRDAGRILGFPYAEMQKISKSFVQKTWQDCLDANPDVAENPRYAELLDYAGRITGRPRGYGIHAGGVIVCRQPYYEYIGIRHGQDGEHVISVDKIMDERIGLVKFDILGVASLVAINEAMEEDHIPAWEININNPAFEHDKASYDLICSGKTDNIFQIESSGMKDLVAQLQPRSMEELSALIALYRPDAMPSIPTYVENKRHPEKVTYFHPDAKPIFEKTYGVNIYQEQSMKITKVFGGRSDAGADRMRKCLAKKKPEKVKEEVELLHKEILDHGYDDKTANVICDELSTKGGYGFNKSHSQAYSVILLQTAYLKAHHPVAFFKAVLNLNKDKVGKVNKIMVDARQFGVQILPPNINHSGKNFTVVNGKILFGLSAIGGIGKTLADDIMRDRKENGLYKNFANFVARVHPTKAQIVALVKSGAIPCKDKRQFLIRYFMDESKTAEFKPVSTLPTRKRLLDEFNIDTAQYMNDKKVDKAAVLQVYNQVRRVRFESEKLEKQNKALAEYSEKYLQDEPFWEFQTLQTFISDKNPFEDAFKYIRDFSEIEEGGNCVLVGVISNVQKKKTKNGQQFAFVNLYSGSGIIELTIWPTTLSKNQELIVKGMQVAVIGRKEDESHLVVNKVKSYKQWLHDRKLTL